jgi:hypothetical protein
VFLQMARKVESTGPAYGPETDDYIDDAMDSYGEPSMDYGHD